MSEIDIKALKHLLDVIGGEAEELREFIEDFAEIAPSLAQQIKQDTEQGNWKLVKIAAHSLKSNSQDLGATALSTLSSVIEKESANGAVEDAEVKMQQLSVAVDDALEALKNLDLLTVV